MTATNITIAKPAPMGSIVSIVEGSLVLVVCVKLVVVCAELVAVCEELVEVCVLVG